ncbi:MAG: DEAD/DEAH box helicase [Phycisphaeraceae bacterium]
MAIELIHPGNFDQPRSDVLTTQAIARVTPAVSIAHLGAMWRHLGDASGKAAADRKLPKGLDAAWDAGLGAVYAFMPRTRRYLHRAQRIVAISDTLQTVSDARLRQELVELRVAFRLNRQRSSDVDRAMALVRETAQRQLGQRPYPVQVAAALALYDGCLIEMATGEGKTLTATLPAVLAGWRGRGCHVITVNDYLAARDAQNMGPLYRFCNVSVAAIQADMPPVQRRQAYRADITYCTNKEVTADHLRDRLILGRQRGLVAALSAQLAGGDPRVESLVMRGLERAIIDEADSILIDEAVTPLIISGEAPNAELVEAYQQAATLAGDFEAARHYTVNHKYREVRLTNAGRGHLRQRGAAMGGVWAGARRAEELVTQAITARELFLPGKQYVVREGKVVIVDEFTGRLMPDRTWRDGLHQAVEARELLDVTPMKDTLARISFQRFFRSYRTLCGMTGTGREATMELWRVYHLPVAVMPTHRPCIRRHLGTRVFADAASRWGAIVQDVRQMHQHGRPVLIGTRSVAASERLSELLGHEGMPHQVLNAVRHEEEANIIAQAGQRGTITVATNMAGRGTDIRLGRGVAELGGLHVIAAEPNESHRIDRQLFGRAARQGDPGSAILYMSLDDEILRRYAPPLASAALLPRHGAAGGELHRPLLRRIIRWAQARAGRMARGQRAAVLRNDDWLEEFLGFAGAEE